MSEDDLSTFRESIFDKFFETSPGARNHLKVSATRLWYVIDNILHLAMEIYSDPSVKVPEVSAVGLRHVGTSALRMKASQLLCFLKEPLSVLSGRASVR